MAGWTGLERGRALLAGLGCTLLGLLLGELLHCVSLLGPGRSLHLPAGRRLPALLCLVTGGGLATFCLESQARQRTSVDRRSLTGPLHTTAVLAGVPQIRELEESLFANVDLLHEPSMLLCHRW